jgi:hypothetical protein
MSPTRGVLRGLRAASLGAAGFGLALVAHVAAGGSAPEPAGLLLLAGLIGQTALLLTRARLSPVRVGISLSAMQVVLHEAFMWLGSPAGCSMSGTVAPGGMQMGHGSQPVLECATGMAGSGMGQGSVFAATTMLGAHIVATAVMVVLLAFGEKMLWFLAGCVRPARWMRVGLPELPAMRAGSSGTPRRLRAQFASGGVGRRGPPARGLSAAV